MIARQPPGRPRKRSLGQTILARTLAERRKVVRRLVVGSDRPGLGVIVLRAPARRAIEPTALSSDECVTPLR